MTVMARWPLWQVLGLVVINRWRNCMNSLTFASRCAGRESNGKLYDLPWSLGGATVRIGTLTFASRWSIERCVLPTGHDTS